MLPKMCKNFAKNFQNVAKLSNKNKEKKREEKGSFNKNLQKICKNLAKNIQNLAKSSNGLKKFKGVAKNITLWL